MRFGPAFGFPLTAFVACSFALAGEQPLAQRQLKVDAVERTALVHAPPTAKSETSPLVFAFHGHGGTMRQAARSFGLHRVWPEAIVVYMQGLNTPGKLTDPEGKRPGWQHVGGEQKDRDLRFFDAPIAELKADYRVDPRRIYATGHSNGGSFTFVLWANRGDVFAALAPSGSVVGQNVRTIKPRPLLHLAGESDPLVNFDWQQLSMERVRGLNGCEPKGVAWGKSGDLVGLEYRSKGKTPLVTLIHPGGHQFPAQAPELIVKFFKEHVQE